MKILITGAKGFVGKNLMQALSNIKDGKDTSYRFPDADTLQIVGYDVDSGDAVLEEAAKDADFVFNLAGANRPTDPADFMKDNCGFGEKLLSLLEKNGNKCPVMLASSVQASLEGRYAGSEYGKSKLAGENLFFDYAKRTGAKVLVYRFPNLFGKWCRPNYNSAVATFCNNVAQDLPITVNDRSTVLELLYIDDLIDEMVAALLGKEHRDGKFCYVPGSHKVSLGEIEDLLGQFDSAHKDGMVPQIPKNSFEKKLYSTFLSYLPKEKMARPLKINADERGSFTELLKSEKVGQVSINISKPGQTKGEHWHHTKCEIFVVVSGHGLIRERKIGTDEIVEFEVTGENPVAIYMLPGYTHNIINLSDTKDLVTVMWANEQFDREKPDTFRELVDRRDENGN